MDRQGVPLKQQEDFFKHLTDTLSDVKNSDPPRKMTMQEYEDSPERQRAVKIARERADKEAFEDKMSFRQAQARNPIKPKPRKKRKRGRKPR